MIQNVNFMFAPQDQIQQAILDCAIQEATLPGAELCMGMYGFHLPPLRDILLANHTKGVTQLLLLDLSQSTGTVEHPDVVALIHAGLDVVIGTSPKHQILHSKYLLAKQRQLVLTGSYNFSVSAASQDNTLQVIHDADTWALFRAHFDAARQWCITNEPQDQIKAALKVATSGANARMMLNQIGLTVPDREE